MRGRFVVGAAALVVGIAIGLAVGFLGRGLPAGGTVTPVAQDSRAAVQDAKALGLLVQAEMLSDAAAPDEPRSDVVAAGRVARVFGQISRVTTDSITFDAAQYFTGAAAHREAKRDGADDVSLDSYSRNRYVHPQTIHVNAKAPVFLQVVDDEASAGYGPEGMQTGEVVTFGTFAERVRKDAVLLDSDYWILVDEGAVLGIEQVYAP